MELRVLTYFLAIAREQSISGAAEALHLSQPTLSRQMMDLEQELGKKLLDRGSRKVTLTEDGMLLRKRAEEILELVRKTEMELTLPEATLAGDICIGAGETEAIGLLTRAARELQLDHPDVHFHITTGDGPYILEQLDRGLIDFGLVFDKVDGTRYNTLLLPWQDTWGVLVPKDHPLVQKAAVTREDLTRIPLILSRGAVRNHVLDSWLGNLDAPLNIAATYNLVFNGSLMTASGMGCAVTLDRILNLTGDSPLCFKPLDPPVYAHVCLVWKKYQVQSRAAEKYLDRVRALCR